MATVKYASFSSDCSLVLAAEAAVDSGSSVTSVRRRRDDESAVSGRSSARWSRCRRRRSADVVAVAAGPSTKSR